MLATPTFHAFKETLENNAERRRLYVSRLQGAAVQGEDGGRRLQWQSQAEGFRGY